MNHLEIDYTKAVRQDSLHPSVLFGQVYNQTYAMDAIGVCQFHYQKFSHEAIENAIASDPDRLVVAYYHENLVVAAEMITESVSKISNATEAEPLQQYQAQNR